MTRASPPSDATAAPIPPPVSPTCADQPAPMTRQPSATGRTPDRSQTGTDVRTIPRARTTSALANSATPSGVVIAHGSNETPDRSAIAARDHGRTNPSTTIVAPTTTYQPAISPSRVGWPCSGADAAALGVTSSSASRSGSGSGSGAMATATAPRIAAGRRPTEASIAPQTGQPRRPYGTDVPHSTHTIDLVVIAT